VKSRTIILAAALLLVCTCVFASERTSVFRGVDPRPGPIDLGILFSTSDILLDLEGYPHGGIGAKINLKDSRDWMLRGTADLLLQNEFDPFSISLGAAFENHLWPGPISLYWGPTAETGFTTELGYKIDDDNWSRTSTWPLSLGCVLGIELFLFEFLSIFLEYQAALDLGLTTTRISTGGSVSSTTEFTYTFDIGVANKAMFGIVFYIMKRDPEFGSSAAKAESSG